MNSHSIQNKQVGLLYLNYAGLHSTVYVTHAQTLKLAGIMPLYANRSVWGLFHAGWIVWNGLLSAIGLSLDYR